MCTLTALPHGISATFAIKNEVQKGFIDLRLRYEMQSCARLCVESNGCGFLQTKNLEISSQLPPSGLCESASAQLSCTTSSTRAASCAANAQARSSQISGSVATHNPGATSTELEVTGRQGNLQFTHTCYAVELVQAIHTHNSRGSNHNTFRHWLGACNNSPGRLC